MSSKNSQDLTERIKQAIETAPLSFFVDLFGSAKETGGYITTKCPKCGKDEAFVYRNAGRVKCNRGNKCGFTSSVLDVFSEKNGMKGPDLFSAFFEATGRPDLDRDLTPEAFAAYEARQQERAAARARLDEQAEALKGSTPARAYLKSRGFTDTDINAAISAGELGFSDGWIKTPCHDASGNLLTEYGRNIDQNATQKHLYDTGGRTGGLFPDYPDADRKRPFYIVESPLEAVLLRARGMNAAAIGGGGVKALEGVKLAPGQRVFLAFDNDKRGAQFTADAAAILTRHKARFSVIDYYTTGKNDLLDIATTGADISPEALQKYELTYGQHRGRVLVDTIPHNTQPEKHELCLTACNEAAALDPLNSADLLTTIGGATGYTDEYIQKAAKEAREQIEIANREKAIKDAAEELAKTTDENERRKLISRLRYLEESKKVLTFDDIYTREKVIADAKNTPAGLLTGYILEDKLGKSGEKEPVYFPAGAVSTIAAPTNHGKTMLAMNAIIDLLKEYPDKNFYFCTYEESRIKILKKLINIAADDNSARTAKENEDGIMQALKEGGENMPTPKIKAADDRLRDYLESGRLRLTYDRPNLSQLIGYINQIDAEDKNAAAVFIDYVQLITVESQGKARHEEIKDIMGELQATAVNTGLSIVCVAQFNRDVESPLDLAANQLGEGGDIERASNTIYACFNCAFSPNTNDCDDPTSNPHGISGKDLAKIKDAGLSYNPEAFFIKNLKSRDGQAGLCNTFKRSTKTRKIYTTPPENMGPSFLPTEQKTGGGVQAIGKAIKAPKKKGGK